MSLSDRYTTAAEPSDRYHTEPEAFRRFRKEDVQRMRQEMWSQFAPDTPMPSKPKRPSKRTPLTDEAYNLETEQLVNARAKLRHIRAILNGPGPNGGFTRVDEDRQADYCDDLAERIGERA